MPLIATRGYAAPETGAAYARALELCETLGHVDQLLPILYGRWVHHFASGKQPEGRRLAGEFLSLAEAGTDRAMQLVGHRTLGMSLLHLGELREGRLRIERALALYDPERDGPLAFRFGQDQRSSGLAFLSLALWLSGLPDQAARTVEQALAALAGLNHANSRGYVVWLAATLAQLRGDAAAVRAHADELISLAEEQGLGLWLARGRLFREWSLAREEPSGLADAVAECRATQSLLHWPYHLGLLADALWRSDRSEEGLRVVDEALTLVEETGERWWEAELHRLRGQLSCLFRPRTRPGPRRPTKPASGSRGGRVRECWSCAWRRVSPGSGPSRIGGGKRVTCSRRSTARSPKASMCRTCGMPRRCSMISDERHHDAFGYLTPGLARRADARLQRDPARPARGRGPARRRGPDAAARKPVSSRA